MTRGPLVGHDNLSEFWFRSMNIAPDLVCTLKRTYVKVRSNATSSIQCTFALSGTEVIAVKDNHELLRDKVVTLRPVYTSVENGGDKLDGLIFLDGGENSTLSFTATSETNTVGSNDPVDSLQEVLQRYQRMSDAVVRAKAQSKEAKSKSNRRRRRALYSSPVQQTLVEEWLSASPDDIQTKHSDQHNLQLVAMQASSTQHACVMKDSVCIARTNEQCLSANDRVSPSREYTVMHGPKGEVLLTAPFSFTCCVDLNFNADQKIESLCVHYLD